MIIGAVNNFREAVISLVISGPAGQTQEIEAVIDTGFTGSLSLPSTLVTLLNLPFRRRGRALLADGSETIFDTYEADVLWDGNVHRVAVDEADTDPLLGMSLLYKHKLTIEIVNGGAKGQESRAHNQALESMKTPSHFGRGLGVRD